MSKENPMEEIKAFAVCRAGDVVFLECTHSLPPETMQRLNDILGQAEKKTGIHIIVLHPGIHVARSYPQPVRDALEALRWMAKQPQHHDLMNATLTDSGKSGFTIVEELEKLGVR